MRRRHPTRQTFRKLRAQDACGTVPRGSVALRSFALFRERQSRPQRNNSSGNERAGDEAISRHCDRQTRLGHEPEGREDDWSHESVGQRRTRVLKCQLPAWMRLSRVEPADFSDRNVFFFAVTEVEKPKASMALQLFTEFARCDQLEARRPLQVRKRLIDTPSTAGGAYMVRLCLRKWILAAVPCDARHGQATDVQYFMPFWKQLRDARCESWDGL